MTHTIREFTKSLYFSLFQKRNKILVVLNPLKKLCQSSIISDIHTKSITFFAACNWKCPKKVNISNMTTESQYLMAGITQFMEFPSGYCLQCSGFVPKSLPNVHTKACFSSRTVVPYLYTTVLMS